MSLLISERSLLGTFSLFLKKSWKSNGFLTVMGFLSQEVPSKKNTRMMPSPIWQTLQGRLVGPSFPPNEGTFEQIKAHRELKRRKELLKALMFKGKVSGEWFL